MFLGVHIEPAAISAPPKKIVIAPPHEQALPSEREELQKKERERYSGTRRESTRETELGERMSLNQLRTGKVVREAVVKLAKSYEGPLKVRTRHACGLAGFTTEKKAGSLEEPQTRYRLGSTPGGKANFSAGLRFEKNRQPECSGGGAAVFSMCTSTSRLCFADRGSRPLDGEETWSPRTTFLLPLEACLVGGVVFAARILGNGRFFSKIALQFDEKQAQTNLGLLPSVTYMQKKLDRTPTFVYV